MKNLFNKIINRLRGSMGPQGPPGPCGATGADGGTKELHLQAQIDHISLALDRICARLYRLEADKKAYTFVGTKKVADLLKKLDHPEVTDNAPHVIAVFCDVCLGAFEVGSGTVFDDREGKVCPRCRAALGIGKDRIFKARKAVREPDSILGNGTIDGQGKFHPDQGCSGCCSHSCCQPARCEGCGCCLDDDCIGVLCGSCDDARRRKEGL